MLIVETYLAPSQVHGIGLFAAKDIPGPFHCQEISEFYRHDFAS